MHSEYALSLLLEAVLLLVFGLLGANLALHTGLMVPATVLLLCSWWAKPRGLRTGG